MPRRPRRTPQTRNRAEDRAIRSLDQLAEFEELFGGMVQQLKNDIKSGMKPEQLRDKYASLVTARTINIALVDPDSGKALAAAKDVIDRHAGKPKESLETTHRLEKLPDQELEALVLSELKSIAGQDNDADEKH